MSRAAIRRPRSPRVHAGCVVVAAAFVVAWAGCAANRPPPAEPPAATSPATPAAAGAQGYPSQPAYAQPAQPATPGYPAPPPPPAPQATTPGKPGLPDTPARAAARDFETAERQLLVAAGDCASACRALGSMDRAAGQICTLASSNEDQERCTSAKSKVQSARDKVRNSCGECKETSTDRNAPIPSSR